MSTISEQNKTMILRVYEELINQENRAMIDETYADKDDDISLLMQLEVLPGPTKD